MVDVAPCAEPCAHGRADEQQFLAHLLWRAPAKGGGAVSFVCLERQLHRVVLCGQNLADYLGLRSEALLDMKFL